MTGLLCGESEQTKREENIFFFTLRGEVVTVEIVFIYCQNPQ